MGKAQEGEGEAGELGQSGTASGDMGESIEELRLNNAHLETELDEARAQLADAEKELDLRLETLQVIRSIAMPAPPPANSDSLDDTALLEAVQRHAASTEELAKVTAELGQTQSQTQVYKQQSEARVACYGFEIGDLALFQCDADREGCWEAFNLGCPHHYLDLGPLGEDLHDERQILGRIQSKVKRQATGAGEGGDTEANPFGLEEGLEFYLVTIQPMGT